MCTGVLRSFASLIARTLSDVWVPSIENVPLSQEFANTAASLLWGDEPGAMLCGPNAALRMLVQALVGPMLFLLLCFPCFACVVAVCYAVALGNGE